MHLLAVSTIRYRAHDKSLWFATIHAFRHHCSIHSFRKGWDFNVIPEVVLWALSIRSRRQRHIFGILTWLIWTNKLFKINWFCSYYNYYIILVLGIDQCHFEVSAIEEPNDKQLPVDISEAKVENWDWKSSIKKCGFGLV